MAEIPTNVGLKTLMLEISPQLAKEMITKTGAAKELEGTEFSMVVEVSDYKFSYVVKNGTEFNVQESDLDNPMVRIKVKEEDLMKMIQTQSSDMMLGMQSDLNRTKYDVLKSLKGSFVAELENDDGSIFTIETIFNGALEPKAVFKMKTSDSIAMARKETNPVNLFMSGAMKIEGDMAFAMSTQPLFT